MSLNSNVLYRPLDADSRWGYGSFTFPALRHLLRRLGDGGAMAVAADDAAGSPLGLALGVAANGDGGQSAAELMSIYVRPESRRQGVAAGVLAAFTDICRQQGRAEVRATYMTGQPTTPAVEALFARAGWTPPETRMLVVQATLESIRAAPWMRDYPLAENMRIVRWLDLTEVERAGIVDSQSVQAWIPEDLYPFNHEAGCEPTTSLALKVDGKVVGWTINHRVGHVLRYTCSFMHRRLQRLGRILLLYNESVARMPQAGLDTGMWTVPIWHPNMAAFARRWMAPYATRFDETRGSRRSL
ncbi:MAG: GNAT family N-acetyltransferase [Rhodocyclales bacterium]|nr:GNAT family N-acetyltransferase [Rhodocyclales bacterium]